jgi:hypothetical protein
MRNTLLHLFATLLFGAVTTAALATCVPPAKPGAVICFPTTNATITFPMQFEGAATGENGLPITKMILYSNNNKIVEQDNANTIIAVDPSDGYNETYHIVLNAWDSEGHLFQYSENVNPIGGDYLCSHPASGINMCSPPNGSYWPNNFLELLAYGSADVTSMNVWQNGNLVQVTNGNVALMSIGNPVASPNWQNFTVKAYKGSQALYTASSNYKIYYAFQGAGECPFGPCPPGLQIQHPANYEDVNSPFTVQAQTVQNPAPITTMKVYLDSTVVQVSSGATIVAEVTASPGTHLLTVQAWDTTGMLYKTQQTVNVY